MSEDPRNIEGLVSYQSGNDPIDFTSVQDLGVRKLEQGRSWHEIERICPKCRRQFTLREEGIISGYEAVKNLLACNECERTVSREQVAKLIEKKSLEIEEAAKRDPSMARRMLFDLADKIRGEQD